MELEIPLELLDLIASQSLKSHNLYDTFNIYLALYSESSKRYLILEISTMMRHISRFKRLITELNNYIEIPLPFNIYNTSKNDILYYHFTTTERLDDIYSDDFVDIDVEIYIALEIKTGIVCYNSGYGTLELVLPETDLIPITQQSGHLDIKLLEYINNMRGLIV